METQVKGDDPYASQAEGAMATTWVANDAPPVSIGPESITSPPSEEPSCSMEVEEGEGDHPPVSPVSYKEDELLTADDAAGIEGEMANLTVSSPKGGDEGTSA